MLGDRGRAHRVEQLGRDAPRLRGAPDVIAERMAGLRGERDPEQRLARLVEIDARVFDLGKPRGAGLPRGDEFHLDRRGPAHGLEQTNAACRSDESPVELRIDFELIGHRHRLGASRRKLIRR